MKKNTTQTIISDVYANSSQKLQDIKFSVDAFFEVMIEKLKAGESVDIRGLGVFSPVTTKPRRRYSISAKQVITMDGVPTIEFALSKSLKKSLKEKSAECTGTKIDEKIR